MRILRAVCRILCVLITILLFACGGPETQNGEAVFSAQPETVPSETTELLRTPEPVKTVVLYGTEYPVDLKTLALSEPVTDLSPLAGALPDLPACRSVELTLLCDPAKTALSTLEADRIALQNGFPDVTFVCRLLIGGEPAETVQSYSFFAAADCDAEIAAALRLCPALNEIDLSAAAVSRETVASAVREAPGVRFLWNDAVYGVSASDTETLSFSGEQDLNALSSYLGCFGALSEVDLRETTLTEAQADALCDAFPETAFHRAVVLNGIETDNYAETLDFSGAQIDSFDAFSDALNRFPKLTRLLMHDCSLTDEQLAALSDRYPGVKVVWTVHMKRWTVSTDAVAFSTMQSGLSTNRLRTEDVRALRFCRDLIALDLGHNDVDDLSWITDLKNLQVLILADNRNLRDITPLGTLKKLKYLELFLTGVKDISPLSELEELLDVNLFITRVTDLSPLLSCRKLERIWIGEQVAGKCDKESVQRLLNAFPNAEFDLVSAGSTKRGWREHPRYYAFVEMFKTNEPVDPFLP